jgi:hypothetical protein
VILHAEELGAVAVVLAVLLGVTVRWLLKVGRSSPERSG